MTWFRSLSTVPLVTILTVGTYTGASGAPETPPRLTFRAEIDVVNLNLTATDARQRFVTDLTEQEIKVFEDGVPQRVSLFSCERIPLSLAVLIDSSASMEPKLALARSAAQRLVSTLRPEDEALVAAFNHRHRVLQDFTGDKPRLEAAIEGIQADGATGLYSALYVTLRELAQRGTTGTLRRRAVVVLSDGEDTSSLVTDDQVLELARKSGVAVYAISLRPQRMDLQSNQHLATFFMTTVAQDTGGRVFFPAAARDLDAVYGLVAEELRTQYGVGYVSTNPQRDGKWRRIDIHSARGSVALRHRAGYFAPRDRTRAGHAGSGHGSVHAGGGAQ